MMESLILRCRITSLRWRENGNVAMVETGKGKWDNTTQMDKDKSGP